MSFNNDNTAEIKSKNSNNDISISTSIDSILNIEDNYSNGDDSPSRLRLNREQEISLKSNENNNNQNRNLIVKSYLLYGNHIENIHPKYLGKTRAFLYINNYPLIIIGPDCKYFKIF